MIVPGMWLTHEESASENIIVTHLVKKFLPFMEPESSFPYSQQPAARHYPRQTNSVHIFTPHSFKIHFNVILP